MKRIAIKTPNPKGIRLPPGNVTLTVVKRIEPATLPKRLRGIYQRVAKGAAKLSSVAGDNRHKRWSVRILLKMKLVKAQAEVKPAKRSKRSAPKRAAAQVKAATP